MWDTSVALFGSPWGHLLVVLCVLAALAWGVLVVRLLVNGLARRRGAKRRRTRGSQ